MTKTELRDAICQETGVSAETADAVLTATFEAIIAAVAQGEKVTLAKFGTFEPRERAARKGRNPQSGEELDIAASTAPAFKPASSFKQRVAEK